MLLRALSTVLLLAATTTAQGSELPTPTGPNRVGTVTHHWIDLGRAEDLSTDPNDARQLIAQFWYPARAAVGDPVAYFPEVRAVQAALRADQRSGLRRMASVLEAHANVATAAVRGAEVIEGDKLPVVVISPGGDMSRHWHTALAQELASHGYAVVALSHAHSGLDVFPKGGLLMSHERWRGARDETEEQALARDEALSDLLGADARFALDQLEELDQADPKRRFTGRLDLSKVAILGHSRGGKTAARACSTDERFKACVVLDNVGPRPERQSGLRQPMMTVRSSDADDWDAARIEELRGYLAANGSESHEVVVRGSSHHSFTDLPFVEPRRFGAEIDPERAHGILTSLTLAFLDRVLRGADTSVEAAAADFNEVEVTKTAG